MASSKRSGKKGKTKSSAASSDDDEDSMPIAASLTNGTKAKKPAKGELKLTLLCVANSV
jgi:hypothetical protein